MPASFIQRGEVMKIRWQQVNFYESKWECSNCDGYLEYCYTTEDSWNIHKCNKCGVKDIPEGNAKYPVLVARNETTNKIVNWRTE